MYVPTPSNGTDIKYLKKDVLNDKIWRASEKIDGVRRLFYKDPSGRIKTFSKSGKSDIWLTHIEMMLKQPRFQKNTVYDCELVDRESYFNKIPGYELRTITNSKASQKYKDNKKDLMAICFDVYTPKVFESGRKRDLRLKNLFTPGLLSDPIIQVPIFGNVRGNDVVLLSQLMKLVDLYSGEGIMLMDMDAPHISGKSKSIIKIKNPDEYIGTIVDCELATRGTKIDGGISALICKVDGCTVPVRVGSGLTNEERYRMAESFDDYIGRDIEIESYTKTRDKRGNISLSVPIFKRLL